MNSWKLSEEEEEQFREKSEELINEKMKLLLYNEYIASQRKGFITVMDFIINKIHNLIDQGKISDYIEIIARIKSAESALKNDDAKALDDIFGMEIITKTEEEYDKIIKNLTPYMRETKSKNHNKPNGYKAKHRYWTFKKENMQHLEEQLNYENDIPMIEIQFKTEKVKKLGSANHEYYKKQKREDIQEKYDKGEFNVFNTPFMWASEKENQKIKMRLLTEEETLEKVYPFLNTKSKRGINK